MSIYHCDYCDRFCDDDWNPAGEHPTDKTKHVCDECLQEIDEGDEMI